jgi:glycosyltransferase involved in cell wall biosynthesis
MPQILFVAVHPPGRVPSQRFRFEQYVDFLAEEGFVTTFSSLMRPRDYGIVYDSARHVRKALIAGRGLVRRLGDLASAAKYDIVFVQREAIQLGTALFEDAFRRSGARLVFDFDDAIWLPNASEANRRLAWLKRPGKTAKIISLADAVFAGNAYLEAYARRLNPQTKLIPTTIDTGLYVKDDPPRDRERVCIGWSGSPTTVEHLRLLIPVLRRIRRRFGHRVYFKVIGDGRFRSMELDICGIDWNPRTEIEDLREFDIGLMPLPHDEWAKGKCGLKGLQYMALGTPAAMSPVGVNTEIIDDGRNGVLADSDDEWVEKLSRLIESPVLRRDLGRAARDTVVARYSVESQKWRYLEYLNQVLERRRPPARRRVRHSEA